MGYIVLFIIAVWILYQIVDYIRTYPKRRRLRAERRWIQGILGEFNVKEEKASIIRLLKENLPEEYQCRKSRGKWTRCNGILLKHTASGFHGGDHYVCSECNNTRVMIRIKGKTK